MGSMDVQCPHSNIFLDPGPQALHVTLSFPVAGALMPILPSSNVDSEITSEIPSSTVFPLQRAVSGSVLSLLCDLG